MNLQVLWPQTTHRKHAAWLYIKMKQKRMKTSSNWGLLTTILSWDPLWPKKYKSEAICWHCELQVIFPPLIAGLHPLCSMKCNQTVIQCCRCTACGRGGLASWARARVRQGVAASEVQPRQNHTKTASLDGWPEAFHMSSLWSAASRHLLFFFFSL